ncbi:MAG: phosphatase PAP2 family protein [Tepidisphaeraceae bacterium]
MSADPHLATPPQRRRLCTFFAIAGFALAFVLALFLDIPLSTWAHDSGLAGWLKDHPVLAHVIRFPGHFLFTIVMCAALLTAAWRAGFRRGPRLWEKPAIVFLAGILSSLNAPLKWCVGRIRPYHGVPPFELHPFRFGLVSAEASFSFPSGDATLAFAMAMSLTIVAPRPRESSTRIGITLCVVGLVCLILSYEFGGLFLLNVKLLGVLLLTFGAIIRVLGLAGALATLVGLERIAANAHYPSDVVAGAALGAAVAVAAKMIVRHFAKNDANPPGETIIPP